MCQCVGVWKVMCKCVGVLTYRVRGGKVDSGVPRPLSLSGP